FERAFFPAWERIRGRNTLDRLAELERSQWLSLEDLLARQLRDLRELLDHAQAHVPYYRERLAGTSAADIRTHDDLLRIPILGRDDAQASSKERRSTVPPFVEIEKATSGTLGKPLKFGYERDSETWRQAVRLRAYG